MTVFGPDSLLGDALDHPEVRAILAARMPGLAASPLILQLRHRTLEAMAAFPAPLPPAEAEALWADLARFEQGASFVRPEAPPIEPDPAYEGDDVPRASATAHVPGTVPLWGRLEVVIDGPGHGNPFVDVELGAVFRHEDGEEVRVGGVYDGDGRYLIRFLPRTAGAWSFETASTARSLDGLTGAFDVVDPVGRGPAQVADRFHFAYADGTRCIPLGTTAYAWTHQSEDLQERTLTALEGSSFTKIRMCVFPKSYLFNTNDPDRYPFVRDADGGFDLTRFDPAYFRALDRRIDDLAALGIEADLILFHAYDRWGFSDMGAAADDRYVRYLVRRYAAHANVWWSIANEYDIVFAKTAEDWERLGELVATEDHARHLTSIHNCFGFYDHSRDWITHVSAQRMDVYRTAENVDGWRAEFGKPVVVDEIGYEGDIDQGWGNLTAEELVRRFWEGAVRGGYIGHGETYLNDAEELWWSKGGELVGGSPARIAFLRTISEEAPDGRLDPLPSDWDVPWGGSDDHRIAYFGFNRPRYRDVVTEPDAAWHVDVIDTWGMTVERLPGVHRGAFRVPLPARQWMAIRLVRAAEQG